MDPSQASPAATHISPPAQAAQPHARSTKTLKFWGLGIILAGLVADLWSKAYFEKLLGMNVETGRSARRIDVIDGFFAWEGVYNPGITFGLAAHQTVLILALTGLATVGLFVWFLATRRPSRCLHIGLAMIIGGALGNLYDRFHWHKVRDFISFYVGEHRWPNFNLADSLIVVGVGLIMWDALFGHGAKVARAQAEAARRAKKA